MASADAIRADTSTTPQFLHARFEVPPPAAAGGSAEADGGGNSTPSVVITKQRFDASNCKTAVIGLPKGVEPIKPEAGDYSYSGMHDHGPLPPPKEGGQFAQIIGLVSAAKKASDAYLTDFIEKEKAVMASATKTKGEVCQQKRKR